MTDKVFSPITIGTVTTINRFVRSATHDFLADEKGCVTEKQIALYQKLSEGKIGLIISGFLFVHPSGKSSPGQTAIFSDSHIPGLTSLTETVHKKGGIIFAQIAHGGRQARKKLCGGETICPSEVLENKTGVLPREMTPTEIDESIDWFIQSALRAKRAGFDGVQLHAAHGYLLNQFLSPYTNRRKDKWGGTREKRVLILLDILRGIRKELGPDYPILVKLNMSDFITNGISIEDALFSAQALDSAGIDGIEISGGIAESEGSPMSQTDIDTVEKEAYFESFASVLKPLISCPLILVGGIRSLEKGSSILDKETADMLSLSRPFIREPDLVLKMQSGAKQKADCISCNRCFNPRGIRCPHLEAG